MYKFSDKIWFNEDKEYIDSLTKGSNVRVNCLCPFCGKEKSLVFNGVGFNKSTACKGCSKRERVFLEIVGKRFGRLTVVSKVPCEKYSKLQVLCICDCGNETIVDVSNIKSGGTQSCGCIFKEFKAAQFGVNHPSYNFNMSDEQRKILEQKRHNGESRRFRKAVLERDEKACTICDSTKDLVVHHLNGFKHNESLRYDVNNGITLCKSCHCDFHEKFMGGYQVPCTLQNFEDYLYQI